MNIKLTFKATLESPRKAFGDSESLCHSGEAFKAGIQVFVLHFKVSTKPKSRAKPGSPIQAFEDDGLVPRT